MTLKMYHVSGELVTHRGEMPNDNYLDPFTFHVSLTIAVSDIQELAGAARAKALWMHQDELDGRERGYWKSEPAIKPIEIPGEDETPPDQVMRQAGAQRLPGFEEE